MILLTFLQAGAPPPPEVYDPSAFDYTPWGLLWLFTFGCASWPYYAFAIWMAVSCIRNDPERHFWLWIIIFLWGIGPLVYFFARWLPSTRIEPPRAFQRYLRGGELKRLQIAAHQIGNAHQFVEWGEALRESGQPGAAHDAFEKALTKDGQNLQALWGAAAVEYDRADYAGARDKLQRILKADPAYKFGDVSLLYCKTLNALGETDAAREQLEHHTRRWRHPEGLYLLASIYADHGNPAGARQQLEALIQDLDGAPRKIVRRQLFWRGRARKLLRKLPTA